MPFEQFKLQQVDAYTILTNSFNRNRLVHAYIFEGEIGSGLLDASLYLASLLLCTGIEKPCFDCINCQKVIEGSSEFVYIVEPMGESIKKEQIENLIYDFSLTTLENQNRICIIENADKMTTSSSNTLLKFLEEPYPNRYIILLTTNIDRLLDTIKSRCQIIHFVPLKRIFIENQLENAGVDKDIAYILSNLTSNVNEANDLINNGLITDIIELAKDIYNSDQLGKDIYITFLKKSKFLLSTNNGLTPHIYFFDILLLIYRENIRYLEKVKDTHFKKLWNKEAPFTIDILIKKIEIINKYYERITGYVNKELLYASLFVELSK